MPQWIGSNDFFSEKKGNANRQSEIHNRLENAQAALRKEVSDARQLRRAAPPKPAAQRQPGFPSRVITQREAENMRPPRQTAIPGARRADRPVWPENVARGASDQIPVHDGMLDGQPAATPDAKEAYLRDLRESEERGMPARRAQTSTAAPAANAPNRGRSLSISASDLTAAGMPEGGESGSILSVSGLSPTTAKPVCDVGREMRDVSSNVQKSAMEQRVLAMKLREMELRIHTLESRLEKMEKQNDDSLYDEAEMEDLQEITDREPSLYDDEDYDDSDVSIEMLMDEELDD